MQSKKSFWIWHVAARNPSPVLAASSSLAGFLLIKARPPGGQGKPAMSLITASSTYLVLKRIAINLEASEKQEKHTVMLWHDCISVR